MEVVGFAASISTLIGVASLTASTLTRLWRLRGTPLYVATALNEVNDFKATLVLLRTVLSRNEVSGEVQVEITRLLQRAHEDLEAFDRFLQENILQPTQNNSPSEPPRLRRRAKFKEIIGEAQQQIDGLQQGLLSIKVNLTLVLGVAQLRTEHRLLTSIQRITIVNGGTDASPALGLAQDSTLGTVFEHEATMNGPSAMNEISNSALTGSNVSVENYIKIETKPVSRTCGPRCFCQCHIPFQSASPLWLRSLIGVAFVNSVGIPLLNYRSCNSATCRDVRSGSVQFTYLFPCWLLKLGIKFAASWEVLSGFGGTWTLRIPRIIDDGDLRVSLVHAMRNNDIPDVQRFMAKHSIRPFDSFSWGSQCLFTLAIMENSEEACSMLIAAGADVHHQESSGITSAQRFWLHNLENKALQNLTSLPVLEDAYATLGLTSLHDAILGGDNILLARQVNFNPRDCSTSTDVWGATPLHWAATFANIDAIRILLNAGADVNAVCKRGKSVLHWAVRTESLACCKILLNAGANVNICDTDGISVLMSFLGLASKPDLGDIVDLFLDAGIDVNVQNHTGMTALMSAAQRYPPGICEKIIRHGANLELRDHVGGTAMFHAVYYRNDAALAYLIGQGISLDNLDNRDRSIVHFAAACANPKIMGILEAANIQGIPMDADTVENWWAWFNDRDTWFRGARAPHDEEVGAFKALVASVKTCPIRRKIEVKIPGAFPVNDAP